MSTFYTPVCATDTIVATLEFNGRTLARINRADFTSMNDVISQLRHLAGSFIGLARLSIRNCTQGWSRTIALASRPAAPQRA